jgi:L-threonylcarbamoyladenylate synthase
VADLYEVEGPEDPALDLAAEALAAGELAVVPTDTVYGVAARPDVAGATERLFEAKRRPWRLMLPVLVAGTGDARRIAWMDVAADKLAARFWPGALTMVLPRTDVSMPWELGEARDTVGVRVPANEMVLELLARTGPLAVTSANRSGDPTPSDCAGVRVVLGDAVAVYLCTGVLDSDLPSTVVDLMGPGHRVLREGAIGARDIDLTVAY